MRGRWGWVLLLSAGLLGAQEMPRIQAVYPPGGRAGTTVEIVLRGAVAGARELLLFGEGLSGKLDPAAAAADADGQRLFTSKCGTCHELRSPDNRQLAPAQWESTVDRMIRDRGADIKPEERDKIVAFLKAKASAGIVTATVTIAPDAPPGRREVRVVTPGGVSTAFPFYVTELAETLESEPNDTPEQAQRVDLPAVVNGVCTTPGDRDFVRFAAARGQRLLLTAEAYGLNHESQSYFSACLYLYDAKGTPLARSLGFETLDPLIDHTFAETGEYLLEARDLLYRGGPGNVYRLAIGQLGYHQAIYPLGAQRGKPFEALIFSANQPERTLQHTFGDREPLGPRDFVTPNGTFRFDVSDLPDAFDPDTGQPHAVTPPCVINGWISAPGEKDRYLIDVTPQMLSVLREWSMVGPFPATADTALDAPQLPEAQYLAGQLAADAAYPVQGVEAPLTWQARTADDSGGIALAAGENQVWYALRVWDLREAASGLLALGTDDDCKVWVNGELAHVFRGARPARAGDDLVPLTLQRGPNSILVKIVNRSGPGGLAASAGAWTFEVLARRLGSPIRPRLSIWQDDREALASTTGPGGDPWIDWVFTKAGRIGLQVEDANGEGGPRHGYRLRVGPTRPSFTLRAFPAAVSVPRGGLAPLYVERDSLGGYRGDLTIKVLGLPDGLYAEPAILPADVPRCVIPILAEADAQPAHGVIRVVGEAPSLDGVVRVEASGRAHYRIQNDRFEIPQASLVAAVCDGNAPYTLAVEPKRVTARIGETVDLRVTLDRREGFTGDVTLVAVSLPDGIQATTPTLGGGTSEINLTLTFTPNLRNQPFGGSLQPNVYRFAVAGITGGDGLSGGLSLCSEPILIDPPGAEPPPPANQPAGDRGEALWRAKCGTCHQLYDPRAVRKTPEQWAETVDRMIMEKGARVAAAERTAIVEYLQRASRR